jgi:hypothetical protein
MLLRIELGLFDDAEHVHCWFLRVRSLRRGFSLNATGTRLCEIYVLGDRRKSICANESAE